MTKLGTSAKVISEIRRARMQILGFTEVRWKDDGDFASDGK